MTLLSPRSFGAGGGEPYARALRDADVEVLYLQEVGRASAPMDVARWTADADRVDLQLLASVTGPVLDVGCGPGRMVRAARDLGLEVLGVDVSPAAVELAREDGLPVFEGSIFDALPDEGRWQTVLLVDENVGIGGDVDALLVRCGQLLAPTGELVIELHPDDARDRRYTGRLVDLQGRESESFPWAEIGLTSMLNRAARAGFGLRQAWSADDRSFCRLAKIAR
jgi:SAM-dependent methyltransferase